MLVLSACLFAAYYNAGRFKNTYEEIEIEKEALHKLNTPFSEKLQRLDSGKWYSNKPGAYHTLSFESNNTLMVDNQVDSIFAYTYKLNKDTLWVIVPGRSPYPGRIKLHTNEELVFENFIGRAEERKYSREKNLLK